MACDSQLLRVTSALAPASHVTSCFLYFFLLRSAPSSCSVLLLSEKRSTNTKEQGHANNLSWAERWIYRHGLQNSLACLWRNSSSFTLFPTFSVPGSVKISNILRDLVQKGFEQSNAKERITAHWCRFSVSWRKCANLKKNVRNDGITYCLRYLTRISEQSFQLAKL